MLTAKELMEKFPRLRAALSAPPHEGECLMVYFPGAEPVGLMIPITVVVDTTIQLLDFIHPEDIRDANLEKASLAMALRQAADTLENSMAPVSQVRAH